MAVNPLAWEISDLCLGKPALRPLSLSATVADALTSLKISGDAFISVWDCNHCSPDTNNELGQDDDRFECRCVGKISMVDVICFLCKDEDLLSLSSALLTPVSQILPQISGIVVHLDTSASLLEAMDLILEGTQNIIVPIKTRLSSYSRRKLNQKTSNTLHNGREYCWLTQEDVIRFLLNSIGLFSPISAIPINTLGIINPHVLAVHYRSPAILAIGAISRSLSDQTSVAVIDGDGILIGEISPLILASSNETVAAAIMTLSVDELMAYIDSGGPPNDLVSLVKARLKERNLEMMLEEFTILSSDSSSSSSSSSASSSSSSSDEEVSGKVTPLMGSRRYKRSSSYSARIIRRAEAIVCHPKSSLIAVMIQAIARRVNYVWVTEDDCELVGIVTFPNMLRVFREHIEG